MSKKTVYWICQFGGWLFFVLSQSLFYKLTNVLNSSLATSQFMLFAFGIVLSHLYRNFIVNSKWLRINTASVIPRVIVAIILLATVHEYAQYGAESLLDISGNKHRDNVVIVANIVNLAFVYFFWSLIYFLVYFIQNYKKVEIENLKWAASINEIELNKLKSQLNPHFIFNAMNSIRALVDENPGKSKDAITQLSNILRNTLQMGKNKVISFDEEISVVMDYLALELTRYEERLKTYVKIDPLSRHFAVPPLMIQTLVENAIKHGISQLTYGGFVEISTKVADDFLYITIRNSGQLKESTEEDTGFGIKNTLQRLQLLYSDSAMLKISNESDTVVLTELRIPKQLANKRTIN
jgi:two-component system LytT family sensor kinase